MEQNELLPRLFRNEYQKLVCVLSSHFGLKHIEIAEDIVSDTFLSATETWAINGIPDNPVAWLYSVAKNKTKNYFKHSDLFKQKISPELIYQGQTFKDCPEVDLSEKNISDSQLAMIFTVCNPVNANEVQIALALNLLCGFGAGEIADAFLTTRDIIYKRILRAKEKLKEIDLKIEQPTAKQVIERLDNVLKTIYLLFSEGYYSTSQNIVLRKDLCAEAMRLCYMLIENEATNLPKTNALLALMCFHTSRFEARTNENGEIVLYQDQDESLWNRKLIEQGAYFLSKASTGDTLSKYHLEAAIAYWHTQKKDSIEKWEHILELYNNLLILEYSPIAALNRTFVLSKTKGKETAITEAEKLNLIDNHFYYSLLGDLYMGIDNKKALQNFQKAFELAKSVADKAIIAKNMKRAGTAT